MKKLVVTVSSFLLPAIALAQGSANLTYFSGLLTSIKGIVSSALPILVAIGVVYFIYNVIRFVIAGDDTAKEQAKQRIIYGIVGLFVIVAVWGLVALLSNITGVSQGGQGTLPVLPQ